MFVITHCENRCIGSEINKQIYLSRYFCDKLLTVLCPCGFPVDFEANLFRLQMKMQTFVLIFKLDSDIKVRRFQKQIFLFLFKPKMNEIKF